MNSALSGIGTIGWETISNLNVRVARSGAKDGMPILLLSPWPESILGFRDVIPTLQNLGPIIAVDLPGFGRSEGTDELMSPHAMAGFIRALIENLGLGRVHAVGPDIGTLALLFAATRWPELFESMVLGSGGTSLPLAGQGLLELIESPAGAFETLEGGDLALGFVKKSAASVIPDEVLEDYRASSAGPRFEHATNFVRAYKTDLPQLEPLLSSIEIPTLIISSDRDAMVPPSNGEFLTARMQHSHHEVLLGGHLIWEDAPKLYGGLLVDWVKGAYRAL